jgi:hypothetical protein
MKTRLVISICSILLLFSTGVTSIFAQEIPTTTLERSQAQVKNPVNVNESSAANERDFIPASGIDFAPPAVLQTANIPILESGIAPGEVENRRYRDYVAECVDALMKDGTDCYDEKHEPMLVTMIDVRTREYPPPSELPTTKGMVTPYHN